jgi:WD repeat-containing protein 42A
MFWEMTILTVILGQQCRLSLPKNSGRSPTIRCVNTLSWAQNGEVLLSGGDDTTVRLWKMDLSDTAQEYPFVCCSVIHTGHTANIFNAQLLPYSTHL